MATENTFGEMAVILKAISKMDSDKAMACGKRALEIAINIKANTNKTKSTATAYFHGQQGTSTKEITNKTFEQVLARCIGAMEVTTKDNGRMASNMVKVPSHNNLGLIFVPTAGTKKGLFKDNLLI